MTTVRPTSPDTQDKFRIECKTALTRLRMSVTELAQKIGVSRTAASQAINNGLHQPTREKIASTLKIKL